MIQYQYKMEIDGMHLQTDAFPTSYLAYNQLAQEIANVYGESLEYAKIMISRNGAQKVEVKS